MWQIVTAAIVILGPAVIIVYDIAAAKFGGRGATITSMVQHWAVTFPELPAIIAALFIWLWLHLFLDSVIRRVNEVNPPTVPNAVNGKH